VKAKAAIAVQTRVQGDEMGDKDGEAQKEARVWLHKRDANKAAAAFTTATPWERVRCVQYDEIIRQLHCTALCSVLKVQVSRNFTPGESVSVRARASF